MTAKKKENPNYESVIEIADGIFWVGFHDKQSGLHCNPYLIVDNDEALVIDGGSRPDFATVMMKILQTGITPQQIKALLYQHYDPDLCGSIPNFEDIIKRNDLQLISASENLMFIRHYSVTSKLFSLKSLNYEFEFSSGRTLQFIKTPYCHSAGSFVTFDPQSKILFSSDIFGSYGTNWELFLDLMPECQDCVDVSNCPRNEPKCPIDEMLNFHENLMPSDKALKYALEKIQDIPFKTIAPQHGSIITKKEHIRFIVEQLIALKLVGIDGIVKHDHQFNFDTIRKRFE